MNNNHWREKLERAVSNCASHLRQNAGDLKARGQEPAAVTAIAMADISDATLASEPQSDLDKTGQLLAVADIHALHHGNGLGDTVIWPAYRRAGMHGPCEEWTALTNIVREVRRALTEAASVSARKRSGMASG